MNLHHGASSKNGPGVGWVECECGGKVFKGLLVLAELHVQKAQGGVELPIFREIPAIGWISNKLSILTYQFWVCAKICSSSRNTLLNSSAVSVDGRRDVIFQQVDFGES